MGIVEPPGIPSIEHPGGKVDRVERLERVVHHHHFPGRSGRVRQPHGLVHHIEELSHRYGRRTPLVEVLVPPLERNNEVFGRRQKSVQEELTVLARNVPVPYVRVGQQQVIAVLVSRARKEPVIQPQ